MSLESAGYTNRNTMYITRAKSIPRIADPRLLQLTMRGTQGADREPQLVARRNARERRRVQAVNSAFAKLRRAVPSAMARGKRVSKVRTLQQAIEYISSLLSLLQYPLPQHLPWEYRQCVPQTLHYNYQ